MWGLWLLDRTWLSLARWEHRHRKQRMVFSFLNSPQFDPRARDAGERWIIVMGVFVPGLREDRVCVLQMGKCSQNRLSVRVLPEIHWNGGSWDHTAACHDSLEFGGCVCGIGIFLFPKHALLRAGQRDEGTSLGTVPTVVLWCAIC